MRQHPIPPVSEPQQYRAIGLVRGVFVPDDNALPTRGLLRTSDGCEIEVVVLGRLLTLLRRHLDISQSHLWVAYPRSRDDHSLHLQLMGVWEPSTLAKDEPAGSPPLEDTLPEGDDYFSLRGELIYTRPESEDVVLKVRQLPRADGTRPTPFKLHLKGTIPMEHLRHFVAIDGRRQGQLLGVDRFEVIAELPQRGNRGGKARRSGRDGGERRSGGERRGGGDRAARPEGRTTPLETRGGASAPAPRTHSRAVIRPRP
ncbi:MAG: hypothetical protein VKP63_05350 [Cyanobacteriota bacterium]|nr:hypothetical protein [Cyanobacteriota bacterium]